MALKHWIKQIVCMNVRCMNVRLQACNSGGHCDAVPWLICLYDSGLGFYAAEHKIQIWASATGSCRTGHRGVHALTHINAERRACTNRLRTREESSPSYATVWSRVVLQVAASGAASLCGGAWAGLGEGLPQGEEDWQASLPEVQAQLGLLVLLASGAAGGGHRTAEGSEEERGGMRTSPGFSTIRVARVCGLLSDRPDWTCIGRSVLRARLIQQPEG